MMKPKIRVTLRRETPGGLNDGYTVEKLVGATNVRDCFAGDAISEKGAQSLIDNHRGYEVTILAPKH
jgi:hypothetical protein